MIKVRQKKFSFVFAEDVETSIGIEEALSHKRKIDFFPKLLRKCPAALEEALALFPPFFLTHLSYAAENGSHRAL